MQGKPAFVGLVVLESLFQHIEPDNSRGDKSQSIVSCDQRKIFAASQKDPSDAVGLVRGLDKKFGDVADEMAVTIVCFRAQKIRCVQHFASFPPAKPA